MTCKEEKRKEVKKNIKSYQRRLVETGFHYMVCLGLDFGCLELVCLLFPPPLACSCFFPSFFFDSKVLAFIDSRVELASCLHRLSG